MTLSARGLCWKKKSKKDPSIPHNDRLDHTKVSRNHKDSMPTNHAEYIIIRRPANRAYNKYTDMRFGLRWTSRIIEYSYTKLHGKLQLLIYTKHTSAGRNHYIRNPWKNQSPSEAACQLFARQDRVLLQHNGQDLFSFLSTLREPPSRFRQGQSSSDEF
jgi:hypothetical protein